MILGGSDCQIHALKAARAKGYRTVLVDPRESPSAGLSDVHCRISVVDIPACIEIAKNYRVDGVMTMGTDQQVLTAAAISSALGLPSCVGLKTAQAVSNKRVMKWLLDCAGLPNVPHRFLQKGALPEALEGLNPPYVIKPLDSQCPQGVAVLPDVESVLRHLPEALSCSRENAALVEEYFFAGRTQGEVYGELTFSGWVSGGQLYPLTVTDRLLLPDPEHVGICAGHRFPSVHMDRYEEILALCEQLPEAFGIENGPLYVELLLRERELYVNKLVSRVGGAFEDVFIPYITGFDILDAVMEESLGRRADVSGLEGFDPSKSPRKAFVRFLLAHPGRLSAMTPLAELTKLPFVLDAGYHFSPGDELPPGNPVTRVGYAVLGAEGDMDRKLSELSRLLSVTDPEGRELLLPGPEY